ncbi:hypothetical protein [Streptosporangium vulgare]
MWLPNCRVRLVGGNGVSLSVPCLVGGDVGSLSVPYLVGRSGYP